MLKGVRIVLVIALMSIPASPQNPVRQPGLVEGVVATLGTGAPVQGARVDLRVSDASFSVTLTAETDAVGRFVFPGVPPGSVTATVQRSGYLSGYPATGTVTGYLTPGQRLQLYTLTLIAQPMVYGEISDTDGDPVEDAEVHLLKVSTDDEGRPQIRSTGSTARTDAEGKYRLAARDIGEHFLRVLQRKSGFTFISYYPGTREPAAASRITLPDGMEFRADIRVDSTKNADLYRISGKVLHPLPQGDPSTPIRVMLLSRWPGTAPLQGTPLFAVDTLADNTGGFEIPAVAPGSYELYAAASIGTSYQLAHIPIEVRDRDIPNAQVTLGSGVDVRFRLMSDANDGRTLAFRTLSESFRRSALEVSLLLMKKDGGFQYEPQPVVDPARDTLIFQSLPEGEYSVDSRIFPGVARDPNVYVADIRGPGGSILGTTLRVATFPMELDVVVGTKGGGIDAEVALSDKTAIDVILMPVTGNRSDSQRYRHQRMTLSDVLNTFLLRGLPPGTYRIFAVPSNGGYIPYRSLEYLSQFESRALLFTIGPGEIIKGLRVPLLRQ